MLVFARWSPSFHHVPQELGSSVVSPISCTSAIRTRIVVVVVRHEQGQTKDGERVARSINVSDGLEKRVARVYEEEWRAW